MSSSELLRIRDLVPDFQAYADECGALDRARWPGLWRSRYLDRHPRIFRELDREGKWSRPDDLAAILGRLREDSADLMARSAAVRALLPLGVAAVAELLGWTGEGGPVDCIVLVGLQRANGWADALDGRYALFLAVEQLGVADDDRLLVLHEVAHVVHDRLAGIRGWPPHGLASCLLTEGLATQVSVETAPGRADEEYLWFGRPGYRAWLDECRGRWSEILERIGNDLDGIDPARHAPYFLMRDSPLAGDLPKRCGYLVGLEVVRRLREDHPLPEIARWNLDRVGAEVRQALEQLAAL
ncbi:hypothetical protein [Micromonospora sp. CB01531]|uniref:hypothetical protein n=1 Tax=Micromonospora sp. CB01531 TaxID=1718947 RepID=UPI00093E548B|nr:hypothetical protein [Micromonospora sp. CB01531]OKI65602.1 hypothetical protein A6A27_24645 [Micromonospora sp. CB01531]